MLSMIKLGAFLGLAAPFADALKISSVSGNFVIGGTITVSWNTANSDPTNTFSIELLHESFNQQYAIANNVDASTLSKEIELPVVPVGDGYKIELVAIDNINQVFSITDEFPIGAENTTSTAEVAGKTVTTSSTSTTSTSASLTPTVSGASTTPVTTPSASTPTTGGPTNSGSGSESGASSTPSGAAVPMAVASFFNPSALVLALGVVAGAVAL
ncbi:hypothetical protein MKEN_00938200 [Mycena kentingensis (nom. inval.)]|nr:hypothetical protein MKEN_00938200 [Mycena kentingensis (nom. inval.)]